MKSEREIKPVKEDTMKYFKLLASSIFIICVFVLAGLVGKAHALNWWGFSQLCYEAQLKGNQDQEIQIQLVNLHVQAACLNTQDNSTDCKGGTGNAGGWTIEALADTSVDPDKEKGIVKISGCIDLDRFDNHYNDDHQHICWPYDNPNKIEILGTAYIQSIDVVYNIKNLKNGKITYSALQHCDWPGVDGQLIDPDTCEPLHNEDGSPVYFNCTEEELP